ncbi:hypothetical protein N0V93_006088 [Gnomoniopsis smithogilvyi]|uniref:Gylcosyl hydrolase 115 C-terminal domain-containing protein n=1 Tax=Gnomoniopsis smithogilvyi TaxID=1191159 RepID=A0A9W8YP69_9PEZI|nr:hypothetical protein N0V93_006088 [Gnomoniopsis smithogilvyi]
MRQGSFVSFSSRADSRALSLSEACILVDVDDFEGVKIAAQKLSEDFFRVTGSAPPTVRHQAVTDKNGLGQTAIIVGCIESSKILQDLERAGKANFSEIRGRWESFCTSVVDSPVDGCERALVIAGSNKRGAIYAIYALSEQIGVSPWYWWADVPPKQHSEIYALPVTTVSGEPSVRYRGIFINDEAPALTGWVREKFGGYNIQFYKKVFELLLRLRANFLWPAMWPGYPNPGASFFTDDAENQRAADAWGIVVSTSHHEPMQRLANEWLAENPLGTWDWLTNKDKITKFFAEGVKRAKGFESYFTMGMRGEYDTKMPTDDPAAVVADVLRTQRSLIKDVHGREDAVPQLLALYKEVQEQHDSGRLEVPEDVTLLFSDDNFGTIRRLPRGKEAERRGGAGLYYHFEYVGTPRSYKWINSNSLGKTWHQLREAHRKGARQIWVFNVGDVKPLEVPLTFAMSLAWDIDSITANGMPQFMRDLADHTFGPELSADIAQAWHEYDRLASLRRHEHIEPTTFSLVHYDEAENIVHRWKSLLSLAESIYSRCSPEKKAAIFQLVLHPIKASTIFTSLQVTVGKNQLYARQRRTSANLFARRALELFDADFDLSEEYHALLDGKWNHIMCQPHIGFGDTWHAPSRDMISGLCYVQTRQRSNPIMGHMGIMVEGHEGVRPGFVNENSDFTHPSRGDLVPGITLGSMSRYGPHKRWFEVFARGPSAVHWSATVDFTWVRLSKVQGTLVPGEADQRIEVMMNWDDIPETFDEEILIEIRSLEGDFEQVHLPVTGRRIPDSFNGGHVEADGHISMPATACLDPGLSYRILPDVGRSSLGSISLDPAVVQSSDPEWLDYSFFTFGTKAICDLVLYFNMTLYQDQPSDIMQYSFSIDDGPVCVANLLDDNPVRGDPELPSPGEWLTAVQDCVWRKVHPLDREASQSGEHVLRLRLIHTNVILEKIVLDFGGVKESYLGPPPSLHVKDT